MRPKYWAIKIMTQAITPMIKIPTRLARKKPKPNRNPLMILNLH
jgi:hypothetical protein